MVLGRQERLPHVRSGPSASSYWASLPRFSITCQRASEPVPKLQTLPATEQELFLRVCIGNAEWLPARWDGNLYEDRVKCSGAKSAEARVNLDFRSFFDRWK